MTPIMVLEVCGTRLAATMNGHQQESILRGLMLMERRGAAHVLDSTIAGDTWLITVQAEEAEQALLELGVPRSVLRLREAKPEERATP